MNLRGRIHSISRELLGNGHCPTCGGPAKIVLTWDLDEGDTGGEREPEAEIPTCPTCGRAQKVVIKLRWDRQ